MLKDLHLKDLKDMSIEQLEMLASQIREKIIDTVSQNGGHLASNLGVVELTIALHKVFDSPKDKIIFDVSHQIYTHKLLTGRYEQFATLRQFEGLSGFSKYSESEHDVFEAGHSSTAISAGLGYLEAKKEFPDSIDNVIAIVGDASIANGLSFEALNYLGDHKDMKMIIIINDNQMGISKNVGALARSYNNIRAKGKFRFIRKIMPKKLKKALKSTFFDNAVFNSLGYQYIEKIDGHNFKELIKYLTFAKNTKESIVLHVVTKKGKGYSFAEDDVTGKWHGVSPFNIETGYPLKESNKVSYGELLGNYLIDYTKNSKLGKLIRVITPAMALGSGLYNFSIENSNQFLDVGLAEENAVLMASSMAHAGLIPIVFIYSTFLQRAYDELIHDIGRSNSHVVVCVDRCGIVEGDGDTHQGIFDLAYLNSIPNIEIISPSNNIDAILSLKYAIEEAKGPVVIRYPKDQLELLNYEDLDTEVFNKKWKIIKNSQNNKFVITYGRLTTEVNQYLESSSFQYGLVEALTINPLDADLLLELSNSNSEIIVYEEVISSGSLGSRIIEYIIKNNLNIKVKMLSLPNTYLETGNREQLMEKYNITINDLKKLMGE